MPLLVPTWQWRTRQRGEGGEASLPRRATEDRPGAGAEALAKPRPLRALSACGPRPHTAAAPRRIAVTSHSDRFDPTPTGRSASVACGAYSFTLSSVESTPTMRPRTGASELELPPTATLGRYALLGLLGRGGMGVVYSGGPR